MDEKFEKIETSKVEALEEILGKPFKVLNDGFIRVIDYMGSDAAIVQAARVSYGKGTKKISEDRGLIRLLLRNQHTSPFEMNEIKFHLRVPMDTWRQWIRHRTANVNEYSTRYSIAIDAMENTHPDQWRKQSTDNKQGSEGFLEETTGSEFSKGEAELHKYVRDVYNKRLDAGIAREQARKDLPLSTYTEAYWKVDLHNLLHFLELRMDKHAQYEIRTYAEIIGNEIVSKWCPLVWEAFMDYRINSKQFSGLEINIMKNLLSGNTDAAIKEAASYGWLNRNDDNKLKRNRERMEFEEKLKLLNVKIPWC
jgi:thymidylate synthase (FAD)